MDEMLKREYVNKYLFDILTAILEIETFLSGRRRLFRDFCDDIMLHRAIERNIEIIGEAAGRILKLDAVRRSRMHGRHWMPATLSPMAMTESMTKSFGRSSSTTCPS